MRKYCTTTTWLTLLSACLLLALTACHRGQSDQSDGLYALYLRATDSIANDNRAFAQDAIRQGYAQATDSDHYHLFTLLRAKYEYMTLQKDSFWRSARELQGYFQRQRKPTAMGLRLQADYMRLIGTYHLRATNQMDSAIAYHERAIALLEQAAKETAPSGQPTEIGEPMLRTIINMADAYRRMGSFDKSAQYFKRSLALADSLGGDQLTVRPALIAGVAEAYTAMADFQQSAVWWKKAEKELPKMPLRDKFMYYNNRGTDYYRQQRYDDCRRCFEQLDSLLRDKKDVEFERVYCHTNLADACLKSGYYERADSLLDEVELFLQSHNIPILTFYVNTQRIETDLHGNRIADALQRADGGRIPADVLVELRLMRLSALEQLYSRTGELAAYRRVADERRVLADSLNNNNLRMQFSEKLLQYQRDAKILDQQRIIEQRESTTRWLMAVLTVVLMMLVLVLIIFRQKQRQRELREQNLIQQMMLTRMKATRNRITPHFIYNALSHAMLAQADGKQADIEMLVSLLRRGGEMAEEFCTTLDRELSFIDYYVAVERQGLRGDLQYSKTIAPDIDPTQVELPSMCIQIFVENAIKHGLKAKDADEEKRLHISARRHSGGIMVEVTDNGSSRLSSSAGGSRRLASSSHGTGTGLRVISQMVTLLNEYNKAKMDFGLRFSDEPEGGCRAWLFLPDDFNYHFRQQDWNKKL